MFREIIKKIFWNYLIFLESEIKILYCIPLDETKIKSYHKMKEFFNIEQN